MGYGDGSSTQAASLVKEYIMSTILCKTEGVDHCLIPVFNHLDGLELFVKPVPISEQSLFVRLVYLREAV
jgi:hypothetical protein